MARCQRPECAPTVGAFVRDVTTAPGVGEMHKDGEEINETGSLSNDLIFQVHRATFMRICSQKRVHELQQCVTHTLD